MSKHERTNAATPGDILATIEEFLPGENAYVDEEGGYVRSSVLGIVTANLQRRTVGCRTLRKRYEIPRANSTVLAYVSSLRSELAVLTIFAVVGSRGHGETSYPLAGILHISQVSRDRTSSMYDVLGMGDIVKARVLNNENPYQLTIAEYDLGVILAMCSSCGGILRLEAPSGSLRCPRCGRVDRRAISKDYINLKHVV